MPIRNFVVAALTALIVAGPADSLVGAQKPSAPDWARLQDETLRHFQALVRLDTSNPPGNEHLVTDYVKQALEAEGIQAQILGADPNRPNLVARLKGSGKRQPVLYMGHSDVVTVDPKRWTFPPFSAAQDGGYIYGRGTIDDKSHVVAGLMTLLTLKRQNVPLDRDVIFLVEAGEEGGGAGVGIGNVISEHYPDIQAEYCFAEGGNVTLVGGQVKFASIQTQEKMGRGMELTAVGPSGHGSAPLAGMAIVELSKAIAALAQWRQPFLINDTTREFFRLMATVSSPEDATRYRAVLGNDAAAAAAAHDSFQKHEPRYASMLHTSISPTIIGGGFRSNVIPSEAKATLDVRMVPEDDPAAFLDAVKRVINNPAVNVRFTSNNSRSAPPATKLDSEAFKIIQSAVAKNYDAIAIPMMSTGATDMSQVRNKGQQCFGIGAGVDIEDNPKGFGMHSDQERVREAELYRFVKLSYDIVHDLARQN